MQHDNYKSSIPPRLQPSFAPGNIAGYPTPEAALTKSEPEIFLAVNYLNKLQDDLSDALEKLAAKLDPVMRQPYPQEPCKDCVASQPQTGLGRILQDNSNRMNLHISIIKELDDRTCL